MLSPKIIEEMSSKLSELIASSPVKDIEKNVRELLSQGLSRLDLVTREEFDAQSQRLQHVQEQLQVLSARVEALEKAST